MSDIRDEWSFLRLTGGMTLDGAASQPERIVMQFLVEHVKHVFEEAGEEFDHSAAALMVTMLATFNNAVEAIEEDHGAPVLGGVLRRLLDEADGNPAPIFLSALLMDLE